MLTLMALPGRGNGAGFSGGRAATTGIALAACLVVASAQASDHADPIDPFYRQRQEGGITDLFVFPVRKLDDAATPADYGDIVANPFARSAGLPLHDPLADVIRPQLTDDQQNEIGSIVFILCLHRTLSDVDSLNLEPFEYQIHIDFDSSVRFPDDTTGGPNTSPTDESHIHEQDSHHQRLSVVESYARYGAWIPNPEQIDDDVTISIRLDNQGNLRPAELPKNNPYFDGPARADWNKATGIRSTAGIYDDPFIFPGFFGTNVVAVAVEIPIGLFPPNESDFLVWATSHSGSEQLDHVGRSLRTQNPRFELLNTLPPKEHVNALLKEHNQPSLMRDVLLRFNMASLFAYRSWDFVPDVMCFSTRHPAGFPNGRLLTDDVGAILAQHGDGLLYELSYQDDRATWPRTSTNDTSHGTFRASFPYLNDPHENPRAEPRLRLSGRSIAILTGLAILLIGFFVLTHYLFARVYYRLRSRRYL